MSHQYIEELFKRRPELLILKSKIEKACEIIISVYKNGGKLLVCGNGGSCADADHITGELMKGFIKKRPLSGELKSRLAEMGDSRLAEKLQTPLRAVNLCSMPALSTAFANDVDPDYIYAQLALGYADPGDVFIGISTSGNAKNVNCAALTSKALDAKLIGLTGKDGGKMNENGLYDVLIKVPETETFLIQELHIAVYHVICLVVEDVFFNY